MPAVFTEYLPITTGVMLKMNEDGSLTIFTGVSDMGNGSNTIQMMLVSEVLGISMDRIACVKTDTELTLFDVGAYASRGTYVGGGAALKAAREMKEKILREASEILGCSAERLKLRDNGVWTADGSGAGISMDQVAAHAHNEHETDLVVAVTFGSQAGTNIRRCSSGKGSGGYGDRKGEASLLHGCP